MDYTFITTDTETASLEGGICEFALIETDVDFNEIRRVESLIDPERTINFSAMGTHHITPEMVWDKPTMAEYVEHYGNPFMRPNLIVCGHNVKFDCKVLGEYLPRDHKIIDTLKLSRQVYPDAEDHRLGTIRYQHGLEAGEAHRAMGDVVTCLNFLRHLCRELNTNALGLLERMAQPISPLNRMTFGKHRGDRICDLPSGYMKWCLNQDDFDPELQEVMRTLVSKGR